MVLGLCLTVIGPPAEMIAANEEERELGRLREELGLDRPALPGG